LASEAKGRGFDPRQPRQKSISYVAKHARDSSLRPPVGGHMVVKQQPEQLLPHSTIVRQGWLDVQPLTRATCARGMQVPVAPPPPYPHPPFLSWVPQRKVDH
jgi:hypothetical protein